MCYICDGDVVSTCPAVCLLYLVQWRRHGVDWGGHVTPLLLEVAPEIDTNPSFYRGDRWGCRLRLQTPVIGSRSALAMSVHPTYFDLATPLVSSLTVSDP